MTSQNTLVANGDITNIDTSGYQILETTDVTLTAAQLAGFTSVISGSGTGGVIYGTTGGTYDLEGKSTEDYTLFAQSNADTTLIGNDANGEWLVASAAGTDTLQAGNGKGDNLEAAGGADTLIAGNGGDTFYIGGGVDTAIGGSGGDTFVIGQTSGSYLSVAAGTTLQGGTGQNTLIVTGPIQDISGVNISGIQTLEASMVDLTASQLASFTTITSTSSILPISIYAASGGTFDIEGKSTAAITLYANTNLGTTLIGNDADGEVLRASTSGSDTLQAGNGNGDYLYADGGTDTLIAGGGTGDQLIGGSGTDTFVLSNTGSATVTGGSGANIAVFAGNEASYSFSVSLVSGEFDTTVTNKATGVADTLPNVQTLKFADVTTNPVTLAGGTPGLITDPTVKQAVASELVNDTLSYSGMLTVLQDVASQGAVTASEYSSLETLASLLDIPGGIATPSYVKDIATRLVDGDPANQYWNGGGASVALGNLAAGSSAAQLDELIGKWFRGTDLPDITGFSAQYNTLSGSLFGSGGIPVYTDANQGKLDDCYLIASLGEVALKDPASIESMIASNGNGTYGVRFFVNGQPEYVTVNTELPYFTNGKTWANGSSLIFANGANGSPIWAELIEKAFVELNAEPGVTGEGTTGNVYSDIDYGGAKPIALITGKTISSYNYASYASESAWQSAVQPIAGSAFNAGEEVLVGTSVDATKITGNFVVNHMFEVTGYDSSTGLFTLHNPWGSDYSGTNPTVTFTASMNDLYNNGCIVYVASGQAISPPTPTIVSAALSNQTTVSLSGTINAAGAGATILIYDGAALIGSATADASGAWSATVTVSVQGVQTLNAQTGSSVSNTVVDLVNASTTLSTGGQIVLFSGSGDAVTLIGASGAWDTVTGSSGTVYLNGAQASVSGGGDTVYFQGGAGNAASLSNTAGNWDAVLGSSGAVTLSSAQASVLGGGNTITLSGSGDYLGIYNTAGAADQVSGSGGVVFIAGSQAAISGGGDTIVFTSGSGNVASLSGTAGVWDFVVNSGATGTVNLNGAQTGVWGGGDTVNFVGGSGNVVSLFATNGTADTVNGSGGAMFLTGAQGAIAGGGNAILFGGGSGNVASLSGTAGNWDFALGSGGTFNLNGAQTAISGGGDAINFTGAGNTASLYGTAGAADTVTGSGGIVYLTNAQAAVSGGSDGIVFAGASGDVASLSGTGGNWDYVAGSGGTLNLNGAQTTVTGDNETINLSGAGNIASLYATGAAGDAVNGSNGSLILNGVTASVTGNSDTLTIGGAANTVTANGASEAFVFQPAFGQDMINGFAATDSMTFSASDFANWSALLSHMTQAGTSTVITLDAADTVTLAGVAKSSLQQSQFHFQ